MGALGITGPHRSVYGSQKARYLIGKTKGGYGFTVSDNDTFSEWELAVFFSSGQHGKTPVTIVLAIVDAGMDSKPRTDKDLPEAVAAEADALLRKAGWQAYMAAGPAEAVKEQLTKLFKA